MDGGCYICSHLSTAHREHREPQLPGKEIFSYLLTGMGTFMSFIKMILSKANVCVCVYWLHVMKFHFLFSYSSVAQEGELNMVWCLFVCVCVFVPRSLCLWACTLLCNGCDTIEIDRAPERAICHTVRAQGVSDLRTAECLTQINPWPCVSITDRKTGRQEDVGQRKGHVKNRPRVCDHRSFMHQRWRLSLLCCSSSQFRFYASFQKVRSASRGHSRRMSDSPSVCAVC